MREIIVPCQYAPSGNRCGNKTKDPTGLCPKHRNKVPLHDIHSGTGKKPLMTAIPRVGPIVASNLIYTSGQPESNEEVAEQLVAVKQARKELSLWGRIKDPFRKDRPTIEPDGYVPPRTPLPRTHGARPDGPRVYSARSGERPSSSSNSSSESNYSDATQIANAATQSAVNAVFNG